MRIRDKALTIAARGSFAAWGQGSAVQAPFRVSGEERISLGARVWVGEGSWFQTFETGAIEIADGCNFSGYAVISAALSIVLEPHVLIARNVHILDHNHRFDLSDLPVNEQGISLPRPVRIGEGSWIGANVVILPGVTIGRQAVIGANSVVRSDVPDHAIAAGSPATVIATKLGDQEPREAA